MSGLIGPGVLFRYRAGGSVPGLSVTRAGTAATRLSNTGLLTTLAANQLRMSFFDTDNDGILETPGAWIEPAGTNIATFPRDCTNDAWGKTNVTAALTQTGIDGTANSASLLTATAGNGTCLQTIVSASASRMFSAFVKRVTGTGTINMTLDNGATWTAVTVTNSYRRLSIPTQVFTNPIIGFRIVTNTDAIAVDYCQLESTKLLTSPTLSTHNLDQVTATWAYRPMSCTIYARYVAEHIDAGADAVICQIGSGSSTNPRIYLAAGSGAGTVKMLNANLAGTSVSAGAGSAPTNGQLVEARGVLNTDGSVIAAQSIGGAAETVSAASGAQALENAWAAQTIVLGSIGSSNAHAMGLMNLLVLSGVHSMDGCRGLA